MKRIIGLIVGIVVSVICIAWSMKDASFDGVAGAFRQANYLSLPVLLLLLSVFYWLKAIRWAWLLSPVRPLNSRDVFGPLLIGFAANNILPAHLGEFVRVFVVRKKYDIPASTVLSTVVLERIFDVVAILAVFGTGLMFASDLPDSYRRNAILLGGVCAIGVLCVISYLIWTDLFLRLAEWMMGKFLPAGFSAKILDMLKAGARGLEALKSGRMVLLIATNSLGQWICNGLIAYGALLAFEVPVTLAAGLIVTGVTAIGVTIPSTPGYFGVIQYCFMISMAAVGLQVDQEPLSSTVFAASIYYHMSMYIPVTLLGLTFLSSFGMSFSDMTKNPDEMGDGSDAGEDRETTESSVHGDALNDSPPAG